VPRTRPILRGPLVARLATLASLAVILPAVPLAAVATSSAPTPPALTRTAASAEGDAPVSLWAPTRYETSAYRGRAWTDLGLRLVANDATFELISHRAGYDEKISTVWKSPGGDVALPLGSMTSMGTLRQFLKLTLDPVKSGPTRTMVRGVCFAGYAERVDPAATVTSPYPQWCSYSPFAIGARQGIEAGWAMPLLGNSRAPFKVDPGRYRVTATINPRYAKVFGLTQAEASRTMTLVVKDEEQQGGGHGRLAGRTAPTLPAAQPAAHAPTGPSADEPPPSTVPDLRSVPAWGIQIDGTGDFLQFSATVWNAGNSPLVVDGFREEGEDEMTGYQYFFDADGNQTGYHEVGHFHWDAKPTHQHWHFRDFASYTLLKADQTAIVKSRKEAFCLANTDSVDTTVPGAVLNPSNTDLSTSCGEYGSLSIREVLVSGWGDTYAQFRAGQSFDLKGLPNGTYFIEVRANPRGRLVEGSEDNNVALRKIVIGGKPGARTVTVPKVGLVVEPPTPGQGGGGRPHR